MKTLTIVFCVAAGLGAQTVQRTIQENPITRGNEAKAPADGAVATPGSALESIFASTEDLNAIRDGYLRRLSGDGCPTDVAIHIAELRARLRDLESETPVESTARVKATAPQTRAMRRHAGVRWTMPTAWPIRARVRSASEWSERARAEPG